MVQSVLSQYLHSFDLHQTFSLHIFTTLESSLSFGHLLNPSHPVTTLGYVRSSILLHLILNFSELPGKSHGTVLTDTTMKLYWWSLLLPTQKRYVFFSKSHHFLLCILIFLSTTSFLWAHEEYINKSLVLQKPSFLLLLGETIFISFLSLSRFLSVSHIISLK